MQVHDREAQDRLAQLEQRDHIARLMASVAHCPECASSDGMFDVYWQDIDPIAASNGPWYSLPSLPNHLCTPCWQCNPAGVIDAAYTFLTNRQVTTWLTQRQGELDANAH